MMPLAPTADASGVTRDGPVMAVSWPTEGVRPGYKDFEKPAGAPGFLDFVKMPTVLKDLDEEQFRQTFTETMMQIQDLGLNRDKGGEDRAQAYLDMATWDDKWRKSWTDDNSEGSSSCGMVVRNIYWLCGLRGLPLFDNPYGDGILTHLSKLPGYKRPGTHFTPKTFYPKVGDALYLYDTNTGSQHIFVIAGMDKKVVDVGGVATVLNADGTPASEITFTSVDGGQADGLGKDSRGTSKKWGCQAIHLVHRKMSLKDGHFLDIGTKWTRPGESPGRPINTWIPIWDLREKFTAPWIRPLRQGAIQSSSAIGAPIKKLEPFDDSADPVKFETWPTYPKEVPQSILDRVKKNRDAIGIHPKLGPYVKEGVQTGYSYGAQDKRHKPTIYTDAEAADPKRKAALERLHEEMVGEGGVSAVMTGDKAKFTWGRGLAHKGALEGCFLEFLKRVPSAKDAFFEHGILLASESSEAWKIVDLESNTVQSGTMAMTVMAGKDPAALKKQLLSVFIKITEEHLPEASQAQWDVFKQKYWPSVPPAAIQSWHPDAISYVIHCSAWGNFAKWEQFERTGGDLKKILRLEVDFTGYYEDKGNYLLVPPEMSSVYPSTTMLNNMGNGRKDASGKERPGCMKDVLETRKDAAEMGSNIQKGDVVFQMNKGHNPAYYVLRGTSQMFDKKNPYDIWLEDNQSKPMAKLLEALDKFGKKDVTARRDRYTSPNNPNKGKWGLRPQVAMEAVIHKNEGPTAHWLFDQLKFAGITHESNPDQYAAVAKMIGVGQYDEWIEKNQSKPMDYLVKAALDLKYQGALKHREWYTNDKNPKKVKYGPRPRIALDAAMNKDGKDAAKWILNDCVNAGLGPDTCPDQYDVIRKTIGA